MIAKEFVRKIFFNEYIDKGHSVDRIFYGDENRDVKKVVTCMVPTPKVLLEAERLGADMIVTHEPTFLTDKEDAELVASYAFKKEILDRTGMLVCRWHDSPHYSDTDYVSLTIVKRMEWKGKFDGQFIFEFDEPVSPLQIAQDFASKMNIKHPRVVGRLDGLVKKVNIQAGQRAVGSYLDMLKNDVDLTISGETCEWYCCEAVRDMAEIGMQKTIIILGHVGSERYVMQDLANGINDRVEGVEAYYIDCGELYNYAD